MTAALLIGGCDAQTTDDDQLAGTWTRLRDDGTVRSQYTFGPDNRFAFDEFKADEPDAEDHIVGTYQAGDGVIVADVTDGRTGKKARLTFTYYADAATFSPEALRAPGAHDGVVGSWVGSVKIEALDQPDAKPIGGTRTLELRPDGTFQTKFEPWDGSATSVWGGSYGEQSPDVFHAVGAANAELPGVTQTLTFRMLDDAAIVPEGRIWRRQ